MGLVVIGSNGKFDIPATYQRCKQAGLDPELDELGIRLRNDWGNIDIMDKDIHTDCKFDDSAKLITFFFGSRLMKMDRDFLRDEFYIIDPGNFIRLSSSIGFFSMQWQRVDELRGTLITMPEGITRIQRIYTAEFLDTPSQDMSSRDTYVADGFNLKLYLPNQLIKHLEKSGLPLAIVMAICTEYAIRAQKVNSALVDQWWGKGRRPFHLIGIPFASGMAS
jgi:hypothetical protein